jgi:hypothetical protein
MVRSYLQLGSVFSAGIFQFKLGQPPQSLHLHTALVAKHSPFLASLMTGPMREAREGTATIHDVEVDSFTRFAEYIYGGDYSKVQPRVVGSELGEATQNHDISEDAPFEVPPPPLEDPPGPELFVEEFGGWGVSSKPKYRKIARKGSSVQTPASLADYSVMRPMTEAFIVKVQDSDVEPAGDNGIQYDFAEVLLCHARVYSMADRFQIPKLKELAVHRIYTVLRHVEDTDHCYLGNLVSLLDYVYVHTMDLKSTKEPLRDLLAHYAALHFRELMEGADFKAYLAQNGEFTQDVCEKISKRL